MDNGPRSRLCSACHMPIKNHDGPFGSKCKQRPLTPRMDASNMSIDPYSSDRDVNKDGEMTSSVNYSAKKHHHAHANVSGNNSNRDCRDTPSAIDITSHRDGEHLEGRCRRNSTSLWVAVFGSFSRRLDDYVLLSNFQNAPFVVHCFLVAAVVCSIVLKILIVFPFAVAFLVIHVMVWCLELLCIILRAGVDVLFIGLILFIEMGAVETLVVSLACIFIISVVSLLERLLLST